MKISSEIIKREITALSIIIALLVFSSAGILAVIEAFSQNNWLYILVALPMIPVAVYLLRMVIKETKSTSDAVND